MSDYIAQLEAELIRAGRRHQQRRARFGGRMRPLFDGLVPGLGAAVAVALAALALVLVGHARKGSAPAGEAPPAAEGLVSRLQALRRPQTAADRALPAQLVVKLASRSGGRVVVPSLTRLVATLPNGLAALGEGHRALPPVRIFLIVTSLAGGPTVRSEPSDRRGDLVSIGWAIGPKNIGFSPGVRALSLYREQATRPMPVDTYNIGIVPDGITRVRWSFVDGTIFPTVRNNVAVGPNVRRGAAGPDGSFTVKVFNPSSLTGVVWYGAHGRLIASFGRPGGYPFGASKLLAQINLTAPKRAAQTGSGIVYVLGQGARLSISVTARGLPPAGHDTAYAIWLYRSPSETKLLGFVNPGLGANGQLHAAGPLPPSAGNYNEILITLEHRPNPKTPGTVALRGKLMLG